MANSPWLSAALLLHQLLHTIWERQAQTFQVVVLVDVLLTRFQLLSKELEILVLILRPLDWVTFEVLADTCSHRLVKENVRNVSWLVRRIVSCEWPEVVLLEGCAVNLRDDAVASVVEAGTTVAEDPRGLGDDPDIPSKSLSSTSTALAMPTPFCFQPISIMGSLTWSRVKMMNHQTRLPPQEACLPEYGDARRLRE